MVIHGTVRVHLLATLFPPPPTRVNTNAAFDFYTELMELSPNLGDGRGQAAAV